MPKLRDLPRYRRMPGEYHAFQLTEDEESFKRASFLLGACGIRTYRHRDVETGDPLLNIIGIPQRHLNLLGVGDWITFREHDDGMLPSVITYRHDQFIQRFEPET